MAKKRYKAEDIIHKLREADVLPAQGKPMAEVCRALGVTDVTYYRWRKEYGGLDGAFESSAAYWGSNRLD